MHNVQIIYDIINSVVSYYFSEIGDFREFQYALPEVKMADSAKENCSECTDQTIFTTGHIPM